MKNIHILPTDKPSRLYKTGGFLLLDSRAMPNNTLETKNQHIYITNTVSEEIKEGDWYLVELFNIEGKSEGLHIEKCTKLDDVWCNNFDVISTRHKNNCQKIILTTDQDLIKDGVQAIDDDFLEWFVKNPSCEKVEPKHIVYTGKVWEPPKQETLEEPKTNLEKLPFPELVKEFAEYYKNTPLIEESKQETLEEAAYKARRDYQDEVGKDGMNDCIMFDAMKIQKGFELGAKWQAERMYSEEEVHKILGSYSANKEVFSHKYTYDMWFEQFKKK